MNQEDEKKAQIASRLTLARKQAGLTQGQVAAILGLSRPAISEIEAARRNVSAIEISRLAEVYGVGVEWLSCSDSQETDRTRDRVQLAARELAKLRSEDLTKVLDLLTALKQEGEA